MTLPQHLILGHHLANSLEDSQTFLRNWIKIFNEFPGEYPVILANFQYWTSHTPKPAIVLNHFERFLNELGEKRSFLDFMEGYPSAFELLWTCLSKAPYLASILGRNPEDFYWLIEEASFAEDTNVSDMRASFEETVLAFSSPYRQQAFLHRLHRRHFLRIAVRDLMGKASFRKSISDLSHLADVLIQTVTRMVIHEFAENNRWPDTEFSVLALGKLGGMELNYSSDIDLMFVYRSDGSLPSGETYSHAFQKASEEICRILNEQSVHGMLYRVDTRLRPDGTSGILCQSLSAYLHYYESRGRLWERQMLIKSRPVAGSIDFGEQVLEELRPFIYPRSIRYPLREIIKLRNRSETQTSSGLNVKTDPGGIRDIEFIVQALQLQFGGKHSELRTGNTLNALDTLSGEEIYLSEEDADLLRKHYIFLRRVEHALQLQENKQTHILPEMEPENLLISEALGTEDYRTLVTRTRTSMNEVREIYTALFSTGEPEEAEEYENYTEQEWEQYFAQHNYTHPAKAASQIDALANGRFPNHFDAQTRSAFWKLCPSLLEHLNDTPIPAEVLTDFERIMRSYRAVSSLYHIFADHPEALKLILQLIARYRNLVTWIVQQPDLVELVLQLPSEPVSPEELHEAYGDLENFSGSREEWLEQAFQQHHRALLLVLCQFISGKLSFREAGSLYSRVHRILAECALNRWLGDLSDQLAVVLAGSASAGTMDFSSDLDLLFFLKTGLDHTELTDHVEEFISLITRYTGHGRLISLDFRLRPEGKSSPLIMTAEEYENYLSQRMQSWEFVAMEQRRHLWGNSTLYERISDRLSTALTKKVGERIFWEDLINWESKAIQEKFRPEREDFRHHPGGLFKTKNSLDWSGILFRENMDPPEAPGMVEERLSWLRQLRWYLSFNHQGTAGRLPNSQEARMKIASLLGFNNADRLQEYLGELLDENKRKNERFREQLLQKFD